MLVKGKRNNRVNVKIDIMLINVIEKNLEYDDNLIECACTIICMNISKNGSIAQQYSIDKGCCVENDSISLDFIGISCEKSKRGNWVVNMEVNMFYYLDVGPRMSEWTKASDWFIDMLVNKCKNGN